MSHLHSKMSQFIAFSHGKCGNYIVNVITIGHGHALRAKLSRAAPVHSAVGVVVSSAITVMGLGLTAPVSPVSRHNAANAPTALGPRERERESARERVRGGLEEGSNADGSLVVPSSVLARSIRASKRTAITPSAASSALTLESVAAVMTALSTAWRGCLAWREG
jgi:hypothetical protein